RRGTSSASCTTTATTRGSSTTGRCGPSAPWDGSSSRTSSLRRRPGEAVEPAGPRGAGELRRLEPRMEAALVVHAGEGGELERSEELHDGLGVEHAVGVEGGPRTPDRDADEQLTGDGEDARQLGGGLRRALRIEV